MVLKLFNRIKQFFSNGKHHKVENFDLSNYDIVFSDLNEKIIFSIIDYLKHIPSTSLNDISKNLRNRSKIVSNQDLLIKEIQEIVYLDRDDHLKDEDANYNFTYFVEVFKNDSKTIKIYNVLSGKSSDTGNAIYKVLEIYKGISNFRIINFTNE